MHNQTDVDADIEEAVAAQMRMAQRLIDKLEENHDELLTAFFKKERELDDQEDAFAVMFHVAKSALSSMDQQGVIEFLLIKDPVIRKWWEENR